MPSRAASAITLATVLCLLGAACAARPPRNSAPPGPAIRFEMADLPRFWRAYDQIQALPTPDTARAAELLQRIYLDSATVGVREFIPNRIVSAEHLARAVLMRRKRYDDARARSAMLDTSVALRRGLDGAVQRLREIHPAANAATVYFVMGSGNSGGTVQASNVLIGVEVALGGEPSTEGVVALITHELVHTQQNLANTQRTLLSQSLHEGVADFIGEMASGRHINAPAHAYGRANEAALWPEFCRGLASAELRPWLYGGDPARGWPNDLGYYMGYRIAQEYHRRATDKEAAVGALLAATDGRDIFEASGLARNCTS